MQTELESVTELVQKNNLHELQRAIETLLFASKEPLPTAKLKKLLTAFFTVEVKEIEEAIDSLRQEYEQHAFSIDEVAGGYLMRTDPLYHRYLTLLYPPKRERLSPSALETLSIIAYRQPVTKAEVEQIRGVDSSGVMQGLQERELIEVCGKKEAPGQPSLYGTTQQFLKSFGLNGLQDLPQLSETTFQGFSVGT